MKTKIFTLVTLAFLGLSQMNAQVGIGTTTPDESAVLELESTEKGFLPPRMTTAQRDAISNPAQGLTIFNTQQNCLNIWVGYWRNLCAFDNTSNTPTISHVGLDYEDVFNPATGLTWLDRNLGATQVASASNDANSYGDLYQWGRAADGHGKRSSANYNAVVSTDGVANFNASGNAWDGQFILRNSGANNWVNPSVTGVDDLWQGVTGTNNPCPTGFRLPTEAELNAERLSWSSNNVTGAFDSPLKLPAAGSRFRTDGSLTNVGSWGFYWSSTVSGSRARLLIFNSSDANMGTLFRANGYSVRCLKD